MLTTIGLFLNFVGSIVLLGSDVKSIKQILKRCDPVHYTYKSGINHIQDKSIDEDMIKDNKAHPYEGPVDPDYWRWWPMSRFLNQHVEQNVSCQSQVDIRGGWVKIDGEKLTFPEERTIQLSENQRLNTGNTLSLSAISGLLYEARMKRIYIYGVSFLALGFLLQLIGSLNLLTVVF